VGALCSACLIELIWSHASLSGVRLGIVVIAACMGGLGGFTHDIVQNKRAWQNPTSTTDGYFLGTLAGIFLGVVSGLLVGLLLPSDTLASTAAYTGLSAGIALKGIAEAAASAPPGGTLTLTSNLDTISTQANAPNHQVVITVAVEKGDGTPAKGIPVSISQMGDVKLSGLNATATTNEQGIASVSNVTGTKQGNVTITATATVENKDLQKTLKITVV